MYEASVWLPPAPIPNSHDGYKIPVFLLEFFQQVNQNRHFFIQTVKSLAYKNAIQLRKGGIRLRKRNLLALSRGR